VKISTTKVSLKRRAVVMEAEVVEEVAAELEVVSMAVLLLEQQCQGALPGSLC
jgi:hypothetical protein